LTGNQLQNNSKCLGTPIPGNFDRAPALSLHDGFMYQARLAVTPSGRDPKGLSALRPDGPVTASCHSSTLTRTIGAAAHQTGVQQTIIGHKVPPVRLTISTRHFALSGIRRTGQFSRIFGEFASVPFQASLAQVQIKDLSQA
jgi:hypothetical protein